MPGKLRRNRRRVGAAIVTTVLAAIGALAVGMVANADSQKPNRIIGNAKPNHLVGTSAADFISGKGAFDRIAGKGGDDTLLGGPGGAKMVGGPGRDEFNAINGEPVGGQGRNVIKARDGTPDVINCGPGKDVAYVDRVEDGVFNCERVVVPNSSQKRKANR
jgi:Ca2+-binding RTX toxin-like protein